MRKINNRSTGRTEGVLLSPHICVSTDNNRSIVSIVRGRRTSSRGLSNSSSGLTIVSSYFPSAVGSSFQGWNQLYPLTSFLSSSITNQTCPLWSSSRSSFLIRIHILSGSSGHVQTIFPTSKYDFYVHTVKMWSADFVLWIINYANSFSFGPYSGSLNLTALPRRVAEASSVRLSHTQSTVNLSGLNVIAF